MVAVTAIERKPISGKKFASLRSSLVLTQEELARAIGMGISNLRRIESAAATVIRPHFIRELAKLSKLDPEDLMGRLAPEPAIDPLSWLEVEAARLGVSAGDVATHFRKLADTAIQRKADLEAIAAANAEHEQKQKNPPPRKARAG